jgi:hypothetical protein
MYEEGVVAYFKPLSQHMHEESEEDQEKTQKSKILGVDRSHALLYANTWPDHVLVGIMYVTHNLQYASDFLQQASNNLSRQMSQLI